jgi:hypothetical protein
MMQLTFLLKKLMLKTKYFFFEKLVKRVKFETTMNNINSKEDC